MNCFNLHKYRVIRSNSQLVLRSCRTEAIGDLEVNSISTSGGDPSKVPSKVTAFINLSDPDRSIVTS